VAALGRVSVLVRLEPELVSFTALPALAPLSMTTLAPAGNCICSACTVATVDEAAELLETKIQPQKANKTQIKTTFERPTTHLSLVTATADGRLSQPCYGNLRAEVKVRFDAEPTHRC
jgi:hypothetical protein